MLGVLAVHLYRQPAAHRNAFPADNPGGPVDHARPRPRQAWQARPEARPPLKLSRLLTGTVPAHPASADYLAALGGGWQMLGNDRAGDCVAVTWANVRRLVTSTLTSAASYPSQADVWKIYQTQNPDFDPNGTAETNGPGSQADGGMDVQSLLEHLTAGAGPDGVKAVAFAAVDYANADEVKAAIAIFGYVWTGIAVAANNQQEFAGGQPWDYDPGSPVEGGHSIITGGYGAPGAGPLGGDERFITWAAETSFTDAFWANAVDEAWVFFGRSTWRTGSSCRASTSPRSPRTTRTSPAAASRPRRARRRPRRARRACSPSSPP